MSNLINISAVAFPVSATSNAFSGIFGGSGDNEYSTMRLLNLQMKMLENLSLKIDVIQSGIEFIIENEHEIIELLKDVPSKTVAELYKKDLEGLFILVREKLEAYAIERAKDEAKANKIFQPIFNEVLNTIQVSRAKIFLYDSYLNLPIVSTCLHFEIFCMVLAEQPKSLIKVTLQSYRKWLEKCRNGELDKKYKEYLGIQDSFIENAKKLYTYSKTKTVKSEEVIEEHMEDTGSGSKENIKYTEDYYTIYFKEFYFKFQTSLNPEQLASVEILLANKVITNEELPNKLVVDLSKFDEIAPYYFLGSKSSLSTIPLVINKDFVINERQSHLESSIDKSLETETNNLPSVTPESEKLSDQLIENGYWLVMYASFVNIANEAIQAIDKFLNEPQYLNKNSILSFGYELENVSEICNERAIQWVKFIDDKVEQIEDSEKKNKIKELRDKMAALQAGTKDILLNYKNLEEEIANNLPQDLLSSMLKILENVGREIEIGVQNIGKETEIFVENLGKNIEKAVQDVGNNGGKAVNDLGEAVEAAVNFAEHQIESWGDTLKDAEKRVREGKIIDAVWHLGIDPAKHTDDNFAEAVQKSSLLNTIATAAASIYGGPSGAAAYAAWFTYKQTGNLELALKTGIIAGLTSEGISLANGMPADGISDLTKRTLVTSSIGAMSIAASGGSEKDIIDGFLKGSALSMAREYYRSVTQLEIEGKAPTEPPVPKLDEDYTKGKFIFLKYDNGEPMFKSVFDKDNNMFKVHLVDVSTMSRNISMVGLASANSAEGFLSLAETGVPMQAIAKIPYMNDMGYFHDIWCDKIAQTGYEMNMAETVITIIPATIVTVAGSDTPLLTKIIEELNQQSDH